MPKFDLKLSHQTKFISIFRISIVFNQESDTIILDMLLKIIYALSQKICKQEGDNMWWVHSMRWENTLSQDWTKGTGCPVAIEDHRAKSERAASTQEGIQESHVKFLHEEFTFNNYRWKLVPNSLWMHISTGIPWVLLWVFY